MDNKVKAVCEASATAEKDEAIYNLLKQTQLDIVNGIQKLQQKQKQLSCSLDASGCRLKNNESLVTIHENKNLLPQIVVDDETSSSKGKEKQKEVERVPSLADYVFDSVKCGLSMVDQKQICVDIHSDVDDTIYKVFEDVNPYLARDLPPLIGSDEFYTADYAKPKPPISSEHIDDVIIQIPRTHVQITPKSDISTLNIPAEIPKSIPPTLMNSRMNHVSPVSVSQDHGQDSPASSISKESTRLEKPMEEAGLENKHSISKVIEDSNLPEKSSLQEKLEEESKKNQVKPPVNLAEIIKRGPPVNIPKKNVSVSLFSDDDDVEDNVAPTERSQNSPIPNKSVPVPISSPPNIIPPPRTTETKDNISSIPVLPQVTKPVVPQAPPRTGVPKSTDGEEKKDPTPVVKLEKEALSEPQPKNEIKPAPMARQTIPKSLPPVVRKNPKVKSLFSSSDESDTEVKSQESKTNIAVLKTSSGSKLNYVNHMEPPKAIENTVQETTAVVNTVFPEKKPEVPEPKNEIKEPPKKSLFDDDSDSPILSKVTPTPETQKVLSTRTSAVRRPIFDESDSDDDFFTKPKTQSKPIEKKSPVVNSNTNNTVQKSSSRPAVRKSMFSSSDSD